MDDFRNIPDLEGYVSLKQAAKMLGLSRKRVYDFVMEGRISGGKRIANVLAIPEEEVRKFKRQASGRERKINPLWRFSTGENTQYMTTILVQMRPGKEKALHERLRAIKSSGEHLFPGTIARYITSSGRVAGRILIVLVWRGTIMPDEEAREEALAAFREALADVLDWDTAQYDHGTILMHT
jgi:predicted DNA-binding transcriptional regulator AlpA